MNLVFGLFGKPGAQEDEVETAKAVKSMSGNLDVRRFFYIFESGKIPEEDRKALEQANLADKRKKSQVKPRDFLSGKSQALPDMMVDKKRQQLEQKSEDRHSLVTN